MFIPKELFEEKKVDLWVSTYSDSLGGYNAPAAAAKVADEAVVVFERRFQTETEESLVNSQKVLALLDSVSKLHESLTGMLKAVDMVPDSEYPDIEQVLEESEAYANLINANKS